MSFVRNLLNERRKRAVGTIMRHVEDQVYPHLSPADQSALRNRIMGAMNEYHDSVLDIVKASVNDGSVINEDALRLLARMEGILPVLTRQARDGG